MKYYKLLLKGFGFRPLTQLQIDLRKVEKTLSLQLQAMLNGIILTIVELIKRNTEVEKLQLNMQELGEQISSKTHLQQVNDTFEELEVRSMRSGTLYKANLNELYSIKKVSRTLEDQAAGTTPSCLFRNYQKIFKK